MGDHDVSDGTYTAKIATCADGLVTFIAPACEPAVLVTRTESLPHTELTSGESVRITVANGGLTRLETSIE
jgi:hypothetical protein